MSRWDCKLTISLDEMKRLCGLGVSCCCENYCHLLAKSCRSFVISSCCRTLFTVYPEITCWPEMKPHHINCCINSVSCAISLGTWLLFKTGRSAATLFPAKRKITLVSNEDELFCLLYDVANLFLNYTVMSPEPHRHYTSVANPALKVKKKLKVSSEGPSLSAAMLLSHHILLTLWNCTVLHTAPPHTTLLVCSHNSSQAPPPNCISYVKGTSVAKRQ